MVKSKKVLSLQIVRSSSKCIEIVSSQRKSLKIKTNKINWIRKSMKVNMIYTMRIWIGHFYK